MKDKTKRSVLLFCLDALILLIVTAGTTVIFKRTIGFEVDITPDLMVFMGIFIIGKILVAALMDLTGFGKNFFVAAVVIGVADVLIILTNSFMHFGISSRLLFFILMLDVLLVAAAHIAFSVFNRLSKKKQEQNEWLAEEKQTNLRDDRAMTDIYQTISDGENANPELQPAPKVRKPERPYAWEPEDTPEEDDNVAFAGLDGIDFHTQNASNQADQDDTKTTPDDEKPTDRVPAAQDNMPETTDDDQYDFAYADSSLSEDAAPEEKDFSENASAQSLAAQDAKADDQIDTPDGVSEEEDDFESGSTEDGDDMTSEPEETEIPAEKKEAEAATEQEREVLPFDQTETLPHIEAPDMTEATQQQTEPEPPKTVKASYSRDTKEHLVIGPEEIVLENSNAEIIINEDDLALIRQYMKLQQSSKQ